MLLPNIIKIFQNIKKLWSAQEFGWEIHSGEITRIRMEQKFSFLHANFLLDMIYIPTIYYQIISYSMGAMASTRFLLPGRRKWELSLLHATCLLVLFFIPTKYYQIISNSIGVMACTRFRLQGRYLHNKDSKNCLLACDTPSGPPLNSYLISTIYI